MLLLLLLLLLFLLVNLVTVARQNQEWTPNGKLERKNKNFCNQEDGEFGVILHDSVILHHT